MEKKEEITVWQEQRNGRDVYVLDGHIVAVPEGWVFVPSGDPGLTRRLKARGQYWKCVRRWHRREISTGLFVPKTFLEQESNRLSEEREDPSYQRRLDAGRRSREVKQKRYEGEFYQAVLRFLAFAPRWSEMAEKLAQAVTEHAVPVGSGTVARTETLPLDVRAEAAVIAWMRHQTTAYDHMTIARVKGERREVRRMLAERSREVLGHYRKDEPFDESRCPLKEALERLEETSKRVAPPKPKLGVVPNGNLGGFFLEP